MCTERPDRERSDDLAGDRRGAVLIIAVFMAAFLVGCLWYLIGVGDAAIYRQKMQDGSDSVAYASAVYHARGMNIIAVMNLIMAAILAVLIALKIAEIITWAVAAIAAILCPFTGVACGVAEAAAQLGEKLSFQIIPKVEKWADKLLRGISKGQVWVARLTPWIGSARGVMMSTNYAPTVKGGLGLSISMTPHDTRIGLPVEEEPFEKLCKRAGTMVGDLVFGWLPGGWGKFASGVLGGVVSSFPTYFCGGSSMSGIYQGAKDTAKKQCEEAKKEFDSKPENKDKEFDLKKCKSDAEKADISKQVAGKGGGQYDGHGKTSKSVYYKAQNGDEYFQVYGFILGDNLPMRERSDKRVEIPAWNKAKVESPPVAEVLEKIGFAEAEFYYDQVTAGKLEWKDYSDDALWNMRWRARLRRFRLPTSNVGGGLLQNGIPDWVPGIPEKYKDKGLDWLGKQVSANVGDNWVALWINEQLAGALDPAKKLDSKVSEFLGGVTDPVVIH